MEIGKVEKFDITKIAVRNTAAHPLRIKIEGLDVGQGFVADGVERGLLHYMITPLNNEGRRIVTHKLAVGKYQIVRVK